MGPGPAAVVVAAVLVAVVGFALAGRAPNASQRFAHDRFGAIAVMSDVVGIDVGRHYVDPTVPVTVQIPPPRWLAGHRQPVSALKTNRLERLGYRTDPYEK